MMEATHSLQVCQAKAKASVAAKATEKAVAGACSKAIAAAKPKVQASVAAKKKEKVKRKEKVKAILAAKKKEEANAKAESSFMSIANDVQQARIGCILVYYLSSSVKSRKSPGPDGYEDVPWESIPDDVKIVSTQYDWHHFGHIKGVDGILVAGPNKAARLKAAKAAVGANRVMSCHAIADEGLAEGVADGKNFGCAAQTPSQNWIAESAAAKAPPDHSSLIVAPFYATKFCR